MNGSGFLGDSPGKFRIGVIALANDQVIERDIGRLMPQDVLTYTTRIAFGGDCTVEQLAKMAPVLTAAAGLLNPEVPLDAVIFGCTSGTIAIGPEKIEASIRKVAPDALIVNPVDATCAALDRLGAKRLNLITPYEPELAGLMAEELAGRGYEIVNRFDFGVVDSADISRVTPEAISRAARGLATEGVDATFISCTDFQSLFVLEEIEAGTGCVAISSNQALAWAVLTGLGEGGRPAGFGRLMAS